ncbi:TPA: hypothetical protein ACG3DK_004407, partial [Stenotrophomonas maltophilia]
TRPAPDNFLRMPATEENQRSKAKAGSLCRAEPMLGCCTRSLSAEHGSALQKIIPIILSFIHAWRGPTVSTKVDTYQQQR